MSMKNFAPPSLRKNAEKIIGLLSEKYGDINMSLTIGSDSFFYFSEIDNLVGDLRSIYQQEEIIKNKAKSYGNMWDNGVSRSRENKFKIMSQTFENDLKQLGMQRLEDLKKMTELSPYSGVMCLYDGTLLINPAFLYSIEMEGTYASKKAENEIMRVVDDAIQNKTIMHHKKPQEK